jgi:sulfhydrogenase subunit beta (sulfur reductase)
MLYDDLTSLPVGWGDDQEAGYYRLRERGDSSRFGYNLGPSTWKQFLYPPEETLFRVRDGEFVSARKEPQKMAFIGVRGCELAAIAVQDRVFLGEPDELRGDGSSASGLEKGGAGGNGAENRGENGGDRGDALQWERVKEPGYAARRERLLLVAVNCSQAAASCFCTSTGDGPRAGAGADLVISELDPQAPHYLVEAQSAAGEALLAAIGGDASDAADAQAVERQLAQTREQMRRSLDMSGLGEALLGSLDHPHWDDPRRALPRLRKLHPGVSHLLLQQRQRKGRPDQPRCGAPAALGFLFYRRAFLPRRRGGAPERTRPATASGSRTSWRSWEQQFGRSGCTGCGRCISWCPVGIDLTRETAPSGSPHETPR